MCFGTPTAKVESGFSMIPRVFSVGTIQKENIPYQDILLEIIKLEFRRCYVKTVGFSSGSVLVKALG